MSPQSKFCLSKKSIKERLPYNRNEVSKMKKYNVSVNGTMYQVEIEVASEAEVKAASVAAPAAPAVAPTPAEATAPVASGEGETISAPMPGTILSVNVSVGDTVKAGQVLFILEAMKMENEIMSPVDGTITSVGTTKGSSVDTGALLCTIA